MDPERTYDFVFLNQSCSSQFLGLCERVAQELGPTLLFTGSELRPSRVQALTILGAPKYDNRSYSARLKTWLNFTWAAVRIGMRLKGRPVIVVTSNPPFGPFVGYLLNRLRGYPFVIRVLDVYPDAISQSGLAGGVFGPLIALWEFASRVSFRKAASIMTLGTCMAERVARFTAPGQTVEIIHEWVDTDFITPMQKEQNWFAAAHQQVGRLTVLYSGNLGTTHDVEGLFHAVAELDGEPTIQFMFVGGGARRDEIVRRAGDRPNCRVLPNQPEDVLPFSLGTADVAVVLLGDAGRGVSMPSKTYHMMASGAAILGISGGDNDLWRTIHEHQIGLNVEPTDHAGVVRALRKFSEDPAFLAECRANARRAAVLHFSEEVCAGKLLGLLRRVHDTPSV